MSLFCVLFSVIYGAQFIYGQQITTSTLDPWTALTQIPLSGDPRIECDADQIRLIFDLINPFNGILYPKNAYNHGEGNCSFRGTGGTSLEYRVPLYGCGTISIQQEDGSINFRNVVILQNHPLLVTSSDRAYHLDCHYPLQEKLITSNANVSMITTVGVLTGIPELPEPIMTIHVGKTPDGPLISGFVSLGSFLTLKIKLMDESVYGFTVHSCWARDGINWGEQQLTDAQGCPVNPAVFGPFQYDTISPQTGLATDGITRAFVMFPSHKFPTSNSVYYECVVKLCPKSSCTTPVCGASQPFSSIPTLPSGFPAMLSSAEPMFSPLVNAPGSIIIPGAANSSSGSGPVAGAIISSVGSPSPFTTRTGTTQSFTPTVTGAQRSGPQVGALGAGAIGSVVTGSVRSPSPTVAATRGTTGIRTPTVGVTTRIVPSDSTVNTPQETSPSIIGANRTTGTRTVTVLSTSSVPSTAVRSKREVAPENEASKIGNPEEEPEIRVKGSVIILDDVEDEESLTTEEGFKGVIGEGMDSKTTQDRQNVMEKVEKPINRDSLLNEENTVKNLLAKMSAQQQNQQKRFFSPHASSRSAPAISIGQISDREFCMSTAAFSIGIAVFVCIFLMAITITSILCLKTRRTLLGSGGKKGSSSLDTLIDPYYASKILPNPVLSMGGHNRGFIYDTTQKSDLSSSNISSSPPTSYKTSNQIASNLPEHAVPQNSELIKPTHLRAVVKANHPHATNHTYIRYNNNNTN